MTTTKTENASVATDRLNSLVQPFEDWISDKEAEHRMTGLTEKQAKEKAMDDWYLYGEPNAGRVASPPEQP